MFVRNNPQQSLFQPCFSFSDRLRKKIANSWAEVFRNDVLVHIQEDAFAHLYCDDNGRPNFPIALLVALSLIKELRNLTDAQLFEAFHFDLLVHHALGIAADEVTVAERTMYNFRARAAGDPAVLQVFEELTDRMLSSLALCTDVQRLDSTQVSSNMVHLSRLALFVQTMERFAAKLTPEQVALLPEAIQERYLERAGSFADTTGANSRRRLGQAAQDLAFLVDRFEADPQLRDLPAYRLLVRLFREQCAVQDTGGEAVVVLKEPSDIASDSLQAPSDPDATYSHHKGKGYQVQIAETCHPDNPVELITHVAVEGAHESDHNALLPCIEATHERGIGPGQLLADTSYSSGDNLVASAEKGVDLVAPTPGTVDPDNLSLADFAFEEDRMDIARCPEGQRPTRQGSNRKGDCQIVRFDASRCQACECEGSCPAGKNNATLRFSINDYALALSRAREQTAEFKQFYKLRSGIEATNAALKTAHGFEKLWARGRDRVTFAVLMKTLALNFKRYARVRCAQMAMVPA
jgi:hypothetical protein